MELGTGVFLSSLVLGVIILYVATKDRWKWRVWGRRLVVGIVTVVIVGGGALFINQQSSSRPMPQNELWDVRLGDSLADVKFKKGEPDHTVADSLFYRSSSYDSGGRYQILLSNGRVVGVFYAGRAIDAPTVLGFNGYSDLESIKKRLGEPSRVEHSKDETSRSFYFDKYQTMYELSAGAVTGIGVYMPNVGSLGYDTPKDRPRK